MCTTNQTDKNPFLLHFSEQQSVQLITTVVGVRTCFNEGIEALFELNKPSFFNCSVQ